MGGDTVRVALFVTCLVDGMFPDVGKATVAVLERLGVRVEVPTTQSCCGQMHTNSGYGSLAAPLVGAYVNAFEAYDAVVSPSASCAGSVRHQHAELAERANDVGLAARSRAVASRTYELSEFVVDVLGVEDVGARYPHQVTYHPTCHGLRLLRVQDKAVRLLRNVRDLDLVELPDAESCCGFGGTFALKNADVSAAMLTDKMRAIGATGAGVCTAADASCLMHIGGGLSRAQSGVRTVHLAEILATT
jgi:L-lactate dehydrogenase complex protein LldE